MRDKKFLIGAIVRRWLGVEVEEKVVWLMNN